MDAARELAQLGQRVRELFAEAAISATAAGSSRDAVAQQAELQGDADEPLLRAVVEVALEPPPLVVAGGDDPLARVLQLA